MKFLITGFEPFDHDIINPAWEAVKLLPDKLFDIEIDKIELPVVYEKCFERVNQLMDENVYEAVICVGQAGGRDGITPERRAVNVQNARIPDNGGNQPENKQIAIDGPTEYISTLPIDCIERSLNEIGIKSYISENAGEFVCNDLFYRVMEKAGAIATGKAETIITGRKAESNTTDRETYTNIVAGFVHVPFISEQTKDRYKDKPSMELSKIVKGLEIVVAETAKYLKTKGV